MTRSAILGRCTLWSPEGGRQDALPSRSSESAKTVEACRLHTVVGSMVQPDSTFKFSESLRDLAPWRCSWCYLLLAGKEAYELRWFLRRLPMAFWCLRMRGTLGIEG